MVSDMVGVSQNKVGHIAYQKVGVIDRRMVRAGVAIRWIAWLKHRYGGFSGADHTD